MTIRHSRAREVADFLGAMVEAFKRGFGTVVSITVFAGVAFRLAGVPAMPAIVLGLCLGCGMVAFLAANSEPS